MFESNVGMVGAIWLAAGLKGMMVMGWIFWKSKNQRDEEGEV